MREQTLLLCLFAALAGPALGQPAAPAGDASSPGGVAAPEEAPTPAGEAGPAPSPAQREHTTRPIAKPSATGENAARQSLLAARQAIGEGRSQQATQLLTRAEAQLRAMPRAHDSRQQARIHTILGQVAEARGVVAAGYNARALKLVDAALARLPPRPPHRKAGPG